MAREPKKPNGDADDEPRDPWPHPPRTDAPPGVSPLIAHWDWALYWRIDRAERDGSWRKFAADRLREIEREGDSWWGSPYPHLVAKRERDIRKYQRMATNVNRNLSPIAQTRRWVEANADAVRPYADPNNRHPALWFSGVLYRVMDGVDAGDGDATRLAFQFLTDDPQCFNGRENKRSLLKKLKRLDLAPWKHWLPRLRATAAKFDKDDYKPQEYNDLIRLIRRMEEA